MFKEATSREIEEAFSRIGLIKVEESMWTLPASKFVVTTLFVINGNDVVVRIRHEDNHHPDAGLWLLHNAIPKIRRLIQEAMDPDIERGNRN